MSPAGLSPGEKSPHPDSQPAPLPVDWPKTAGPNDPTPRYNISVQQLPVPHTDQEDIDAAVRQCADTFPIIFDEIVKCDSTHTRVVDVWRVSRGAGGWSKCARNETRCVWGLCADFIRG